MLIYRGPLALRTPICPYYQAAFAKFGLNLKGEPPFHFLPEFSPAGAAAVARRR